ncbi:MAG: hypothetical protein KME09_19750 [Pleurocapsa minor HA4230-MV1]|jgi:hypothetical protein|nr:hypothetical protein [Pleurocapsa minor HA4230-MV1]
MVTAKLFESNITFSYCDLGRAIAYLNDQFAVDTLEIKVVQPRSGISYLETFWITFHIG